MLPRQCPDPGQLTLFGFACAARDHIPHLGLRPRLWEDCAQVMSEEEPRLRVLITDARCSGPETPVIRRSSYRRGMVRACRSAAST
ncbi:MAG TPA: hypothetical protein PLL33_11675 [Paracoccus sp. (in: a-proteobacteria)]|nr:hypothetical protein [Paracoccus sp. (in: a-proteobacteria)]